MIFNDEFIENFEKDLEDPQRLEATLQRKKDFITGNCDIKDFLFQRRIFFGDLKYIILDGGFNHISYETDMEYGMYYKNPRKRKYESSSYGWVIYDTKTFAIVMTIFKFETLIPTTKEEGVGYCTFSLFTSETELRYESHYKNGTPARKIYLKTNNPKALDITFYYGVTEGAVFYEEYRNPRLKTIDIIENSPRTKYFTNITHHDFKERKTTKSGANTGGVFKRKMQNSPDHTFETPKIKGHFNFDDIEPYNDEEDNTIHYTWHSFIVK